MQKVRNFEALVSHGDKDSRRVVLEIADRTLQRLDSYSRIKSIAHREGAVLHIGTKSWDLSKKRHVYLVGAGKACNAMAAAVDEILGDYLTRGIAIVKFAEDVDVFQNTDVYVGGHPLPNQVGYEASLKILELADGAGPDDLFIAVISGGSSALMNCPMEGITLEDEMEATDVLLKSGAGIYEINSIRRHISQTNGGMLAKRIQASGAELIGFGISDAVGNPPTGDIGIPYDSYASTPIGPDRTTLADARRVIADYNMGDRLPPSVVRYLMEAGDDRETPKEFPDNTYFLLNTLPDSCVYAKEVAEEIGITAHILTSFLEGESKDAGTFFASLAREVQASGNPFSAPCVVLSSGETTTFIPENSAIEGHGGPSQELTASFAISATKTVGACMLSIDSEGSDGTTNVAGGITDSSSHGAAVAAGMSLHGALRGHSCFEALTAIGDTVFTGNTGTNLCDLNILYIPAPETEPGDMRDKAGKAVDE
jgi:glycerate 2-kinase